MPRYLFVLVGEPNHADNWAAASDEEHQRIFDHFRAFTDEVGRRGRLVAGEALDRPSAAFTARRGRERRVVVDGPFTDAAEQMCGFYLADLPDEGSARELVLLLPPDYSVEVHHCPDVGVTSRA